MALGFWGARTFFFNSLTGMPDLRDSCFIRLTCLRVPRDVFLIFPLLKFVVILLTPGAALNPIQESSSRFFLIAQLGCDCPKRNPFTTLANNEPGPHSVVFSICCRVNDGVVRYRTLAIWACNLIFHSLLLFCLFKYSRRSNPLGCLPGSTPGSYPPGRVISCLIEFACS